MTRTVGLFGALVLLVIIGGGVWLAVAPMTPAVKTVQINLPDSFPR
jgi:ABC-type transporter Mla subunit MlaD